MLHLYNTASRKKEPFEPLQSGKVGMYVCGITIYDYCHIGHGRVFVVFDVLYRHLLASGFDVMYVRNITDVDDKIINKAAELGESVDSLTDRFIKEMHADEDALLVLRPTHEPRATQSIDAMLELIGTLIDKGHAYPAGNGDVYYSVSSFADYGKLSGHKIDELRAGERIAVDEHKQDPLDFVLWKAAKPGEPSWPSPWGEGRPGWHIECSAMAKELLGEQIDIHGGGRDLQFPHHENEKAQSEAAHNNCFARYWMHNGLVRVDDEKMSKSLNNFFTIRDVLEKYTGEEIRLFVSGSHYRSPLNYSIAQLDAARASLRRLYTALRGHAIDPAGVCDQDYVNRFNAAMDDDLNTPEAMSVLFDLAGTLNRESAGSQNATRLATTLRELGGRLALLQQDPDAALQGTGDEQSATEAGRIDALIAERNQARNDKNWARSDEIRDALAAEGIVLEDAGGKTTWRRG